MSGGPERRERASRSGGHRLGILENPWKMKREKGCCWLMAFARALEHCGVGGGRQRSECWDLGPAFGSCFMEGRRDGAGGSRLARRLPARDWIGVRWRLGTLCEPVFGGGVGCGPQLLGRNGAGPPRAAPGPRVCYQGAQLWVW